ncbi:rhomboid domain-containing protein 3 isoform X2 [Xenopus laevis]|uniref:Rhomboid domain-containing protein 3 isoform X2 n=1 Tax=Xenopus laevis TaxID=8355 RepID=A0A8J0V5P9_XENLA|nr:rhomboid domain-containing protein 3 isoform X2 [Xenopus laevis]XP_018116142.1 rhomboid domain-containing protein 3 isoform X2 [Xenopus laevis]
MKPNLQKCWEHGWGGVRAPLGCCLLMILIICMAFIGESKYMELHLETLQDVWAGHRLFTHILCTPDPSLLLLSLFLLPLLCWQIEEYLGTLQFLQLSCLCTLCTGTLYLLLSWLLPSPTVPASGYLATQLAFMTIYWLVLQGRSHTKLTPLLLCGILIITELLCTHCPFLLHICGIIVGMTLRYRLLTFLKLTESHRKMLEKSNVFHYLASVPFVKCVPSKDKDTLLPVIDSRDTLLPVIDSRAHERLPFPHAVLPQSATFNDITWGELSSDTWLHDGLRDMPPASLLMESEELEEQLLSASIQASLREYRKEEPEEYALQKSSVSALRLQQLERMGFPTGPAVLALAATGKVERAVSLLVEGQVGADIRVTSEKPATQRHCGPPEQAHTCDVTEDSH